MGPLIEEAAACRRCPGVVPGSAVLGTRNGDAHARILFVGEAPGRMGAGRSGIPFHGDESGRRFEALLASAGLDRPGVFVTNALLCLPLDTAGRNRPPRTRELAACLPFLAQTIAQVDPDVVVTLGAVALGAVGRLRPHGRSLGEAAGAAWPWHGRLLVPFYHPGRQAELHRSWAEQVADWQVLRKLARVPREARRA